MMAMDVFGKIKMRCTKMRVNYPGMIAWTLFLIGLGAGGYWLVLLATSGAGGALIAGIVGVVALAGAATLWLTISLGRGHDPLLPEITDDESAIYLEYRQAKKQRAARQRQGALRRSVA